MTEVRAEMLLFLLTMLGFAGELWEQSSSTARESNLQLSSTA